MSDNDEDSVRSESDFPVFYELEDFPKLKILQDNWQEIAAEVEAVGIVELEIDRPQAAWGKGARRFLEQMEGRQGWVYAWQADNKEEKRNMTWLNFPLMYEDNPIGLNAKSCPKTMELLASLKGIHAAGFSLMKPDAEIYPHSDTTGKEFGNLAFHLGLDVPQGESLLLVKDKSAKEENGKVIIFDATYEHSAINKATANRTILYIDFEMSDNE